MTKDFLIIWSPVNGSGAAGEKKVIDALSCDSAATAKAHMYNRMIAGSYQRHGEGFVTYVETQLNRTIRSIVD